MKCKTVFLITMLFAAGSLLSAQGLRVEPGACIKIESGTTLDITAGNLILESDDTGDASLIDLGVVEYNNGGKANVQRYLTNGKWHLVSSPITNALSGMFTGDYLQIHSEVTNLYTDVNSLTYQLLPMKGYSLWSVGTGSTTEVFAGITNTGNQSFDFTQSDLPNDDDEGWNLVGNPYPSVLNWDAVTIPGQLSGAIWLFDPTVGANGDYKYYISGSGKANTTSQYIPSGQGFFVRATSGAGTLALDNSDRTHGGQLFYKATESNQMLVLKATGNNITTQTSIRFLDEATANVDRLFDVNKIISNSTDVPNVYTKCEGEKMAINTLPTVSGNETIPVYFEAGMDGNYSFTATELGSFPPEVPVYLEDVERNYFQDLRTNPEYAFDYSSTEAKAFKVHFKDVTGIEEPSATVKIAANCYLSNKVLHVNFLYNQANTGNATISVYTITGQKMLQFQSSQTNNEIPFDGSQAIYIVNITTNEANFSTKVINQ